MGMQADFSDEEGDHPLPAQASSSAQEPAAPRAYAVVLVAVLRIISGCSAANTHMTAGFRLVTALRCQADKHADVYAGISFR